MGGEVKRDKKHQLPGATLTHGRGNTPDLWLTTMVSADTHAMLVYLQEMRGLNTRQIVERAVSLYYNLDQNFLPKEPDEYFALEAQDSIEGGYKELPLIEHAQLQPLRSTLWFQEVFGHK